MEMLVEILLVPADGVDNAQFVAFLIKLAVLISIVCELLPFVYYLLQLYLFAEKAVFGAKAVESTTWASRFGTVVPFLRFYWELFLPLLRWLGRACLAGAALLLLAAALGNWLAFEPILRRLLAGATEKAGMTLTFDSATGSFWTGHVEMTGVEMARDQPTGAKFHLQIRDLSVDINYLTAWGLGSIEQINAAGIEGEIERVQAGKESKLDTFLESRQSSRRLIVQHFSLADANVKLVDSTRPKRTLAMTVEVDSFVCEPLRSDWVAFDTFFRSQLTGRIDGRPFSIATRPIDGGRETAWHVSGLPVTLVSPYLGGPTEWITQGTIDLDVTDRWRTDRNDLPVELAMHWKVAFHDVQAKAPASLTLNEKLLAVPVVAVLNKTGKDLVLEFEFEADPQGFYLATSEKMAQVWKTVGELLTVEFAREAGLDAVTLKDIVKEKSAKAWREIKPFRRDKPDAPFKIDPSFLKAMP